VFKRSVLAFFPSSVCWFAEDGISRPLLPLSKPEGLFAFLSLEKMFFGSFGAEKLELSGLIGY
jgi:hypothetical protein